MHLLKNTTKYKTYIMTKNLIYIFLLCSVFCIYGCSCNEEEKETFRRYYPEEKDQQPFDLENIAGVLEYASYEDSWVFLPDSNRYFRSEWQSGLTILVKNMNKEYESLAGRVILDGTFKYIYVDIYGEKVISCPHANYFYSLNINNIRKE